MSDCPTCGRPEPLTRAQISELLRRTKIDHERLSAAIRAARPGAGDSA